MNNPLSIAPLGIPKGDALPSKERHKNMAAIRAKNTKPEIIVRKYLWSHGFRYRLNHPRLPGKPDIVLRKYRTCIFVNGCFWHGHEECKYFVMPKSHTDFWQAKITRNQERDIEVQKKLASMGWHSITIWECELKTDKREKTLESLAFTLNHIFLENHKVKRYEIPEDNEYAMAAEDIAGYNNNHDDICSASSRVNENDFGVGTDC